MGHEDGEWWFGAFSVILYACKRLFHTQTQKMAKP